MIRDAVIARQAKTKMDSRKLKKKIPGKPRRAGWLTWRLALQLLPGHSHLSPPLTQPPSLNVFPFACLKMQLFTCMTVLAASQSDPMTEATSCAAETKPWDHWLSSLPCGEEEDRGKGFGRFHLFCTSSHFSFGNQHLLGCSCCAYQRCCGFCN